MMVGDWVAEEITSIGMSGGHDAEDKENTTTHRDTSDDDDEDDDESSEDEGEELLFDGAPTKCSAGEQEEMGDNRKHRGKRKRKVRSKKNGPGNNSSSSSSSSSESDTSDDSDDSDDDDSDDAASPSSRRSGRKQSKAGARGAELELIASGLRAVISLAVSPDGEWLACTHAIPEVTVSIFSTRTNLKVSALIGHTGTVSSVAFSPSGERLVTGSHDRTICIWLRESAECLHTIPGKSKNITAVRYSPDGRAILSASESRKVKLWDLSTIKCVKTFDAHDGVVNDVAFSPDGLAFATASDDGTARLWDTQTDTCTFVLEHSTDTVNSIMYTSDGAKVVSRGGFYNRSIKVWGAATGECLQTITSHQSDVIRIALSPSDSHVVGATSAGSLVFFLLATGEYVKTVTGFPDAVNCLTFTPDGCRVIAGGEDGSLRAAASVRGTMEMFASEKLTLRGAVAALVDHGATTELLDALAALPAASQPSPQTALALLKTAAKRAKLPLQQRTFRALYEYMQEKHANGMMTSTGGEESQLVKTLIHAGQPSSLEAHLCALPAAPFPICQPSGVIKCTSRAFHKQGLSASEKHMSAFNTFIEYVLAGIQSGALTLGRKEAETIAKALIENGASEQLEKFLKALPEGAFLFEKPGRLLSHLARRSAISGEQQARAITVFVQFVSRAIKSGTFVPHGEDATAAAKTFIKQGLTSLLEEFLSVLPTDGVLPLRMGSVLKRIVLLDKDWKKETLDIFLQLTRTWIIGGARFSDDEDQDTNNVYRLLALALQEQATASVVKTFLLTTPLLTADSSVAEGFQNGTARFPSTLIVFAALEAAPAGLWAQVPLPTSGDKNFSEFVMTPFPNLISSGLVEQVIKNDEHANVMETITLRAAMEYQWKYAQSLFRSQFVWYLCFLASLSAFAIVFQRLLSIHGEDNFALPALARSEYVEGRMAYVFGFISFIIYPIATFADELMQALGSGVRTYLSDFWNWLDVAHILCSVVSGPLFFFNAISAAQFALSLALYLRWFGILYFLQAFTPTGPLVRMVLQIISDIRYLVMILALGIVAAAFAFYALENQTTYLRDPRHIYSFVFDMFNVLILNASYEADTLVYSQLLSFQGLKIAMFVISMLFVPIVLLNLLIALMSDSYENIQDKAFIELYRLQAQIVITQKHGLIPAIRDYVVRPLHRYTWKHGFTYTAVLLATALQIVFLKDRLDALAQRGRVARALSRVLVWGLLAPVQLFVVIPLAAITASLVWVFSLPFPYREATNIDMRTQREYLHVMVPKGSNVPRPSENGYQGVLNALKSHTTQIQRQQDARLEKLQAQQEQHTAKLNALQEQFSSLEEVLRAHLQLPPAPSKANRAGNARNGRDGGSDGSNQGGRGSNGNGDGDSHDGNESGGGRRGNKRTTAPPKKQAKRVGVEGKGHHATDNASSTSTHERILADSNSPPQQHPDRLQRRHILVTGVGESSGVSV